MGIAIAEVAIDKYKPRVFLSMMPFVWIVFLAISVFGVIGRWNPGFPSVVG
jgi:hypothetical protein